MKVEQSLIDLALKYYDDGMKMQEAVNVAIEKSDVKNDSNRR